MRRQYPIAPAELGSMLGPGPNPLSTLHMAARICHPTPPCSSAGHEDARNYSLCR